MTSSWVQTCYPRLDSSQDTDSINTDCVDADCIDTDCIYTDIINADCITKDCINAKFKHANCIDTDHVMQICTVPVHMVWIWIEWLIVMSN